MPHRGGQPPFDEGQFVFGPVPAEVTLVRAGEETRETFGTEAGFEMAFFVLPAPSEPGEVEVVEESG